MNTMKSYDEWVMHLTNSQIEYLNKNKKNFIGKWMPVIEHYFDGMNINKGLMEYICIYAETYSMYESQLPQYTKLSYGPQQNQLIDRIEEIKKSISNLNKQRSPIVRKVFNYENGYLEYELEDGNFVKILENGKIEPPKVNTLSILPKSLIKLINPEEYREQQLNDLLDGNRQ